MSSHLLLGTIGDYLRYYQKYALDKWHHLTPMQYGTLLLIVGGLGWVLLKGAGRR
ncbi:MAG: hypothetical protein R3B90_19030 [Planctomycetaceae bacterium]